MFQLHRVGQLSRRLGLPEPLLRQVADELNTQEGRDRYIKEFTIYDPRPEKKPRDIISVHGDLRLIQKRLQARLFTQSIEPTPQSHGSVRDRSIKTNADIHCRSRFLYLTDIANFYPSIRSVEVRQFFEDCGCRPDVANVLTRITTLDHHLALGLVTSPILAEAMVRPADKRIAAACQRRSLKYTRYVDDICVSADYDLIGSGVPATVRQILEQEGFKVRASKDQFFRVDGKCGVTGVCISKGRLSALPIYVDRLVTDLQNARALSTGQVHSANFYLKKQLWGRVQFVRWLNANQAKRLVHLFRTINWRAYSEEAARQRLVVAKIRFADRTSAAK